MTNPLNRLNQIPEIKVPTSTLIYEALREAILSNQLPAGTQLVESQLAKRFKVSKTPIREALQRLVHTGLADSELAKGVIVHQLTEQEIHDVVEMRLVIEPMAIQQSIPNMTNEDVLALSQTLQDAYTAMQEEDYVRLSQLNSDFHWGLCAKAQNRLLLEWLSSLNDRRRLVTMQGWAIKNRSEEDWQQHQAIMKAVEAGHVEKAVEALQEHITSFAQVIFEHFERQRSALSSDLTEETDESS